jgi:hypothetical protein
LENNLKNLRFTLSTAASVVISLVSFASQGHATVFQAEGLFSDGSILGGTLSIDTNTGTVTASDLTIGVLGTFSTIIFQANSGSPLGYSVIADNAAGTEEFSFGLVTDSLVGYGGGDLCSQGTVGCFSSNYYPILDPFDQTALSTGRVIGASAAAPEPAFLFLCGTPFAFGLLCFHWCRKPDHSLPSA